MTISKRMAGAMTGVLASTLLTVPLLATSAHAQTMAEDRPSVAPSVFFPAAARRAHDLRTAGKRPGTTIKAGCGTKVVAAHPGTAYVSSSPKSGPYLVTIVTSPGRTTTYYGFMKSTSVVSGQIVQAGQEIGRVGRKGSAAPKSFCSLYFAVRNNYGKNANPSRWLDRLVGKPLNSTSLFGNWGFVVASLNTLGADHTRAGSSRYPTYDVRTPGQVNLLTSYGADVVGLQEFQKVQRDDFMAISGGTYGIYPDDATLNDPTSPFLQGNVYPTENSIIWRNATMEFVSASFIRVPYFVAPRNMPVVLLRERATGQMAYFINVHNPASGVGWGDQSAARAQAIAVERQEIIDLRATGLPVFLTGDFNDAAPAFCGITTQMLAITPDSIPSMGCAMPKSSGIDWIFAAGPARFTRYARDWKPKNLKLTDHPIVWARAHLSE